MNEPPRLPFWVTPAQFAGNLVISKDGLKVKHFSLHLPSDRKLNIDMEWITQLANEETGEGENMEVEIGYQPKMDIIMVHIIMLKHMYINVCYGFSASCYCTLYNHLL